MTVETRFTITKSEYLRALRSHFRKQLNPNRDGVASVLAVCSGLYLFLFTTLAELAWLLIVPGLVLGVFVAYAFLWLPWFVYQSQPRLKSEHHLQFSDDAIQWKTDGINATIQWATCRSWSCDNEFYILYHGAKDFTVVPRRALTPEAHEQLTSLLNQKIGRARACVCR